MDAIELSFTKQCEEFECNQAKLFCEIRSKIQDVNRIYQTQCFEIERLQQRVRDLELQQQQQQQQQSSVKETIEN